MPSRTDRFNDLFKAPQKKKINRGKTQYNYFDYIKDLYINRYYNTQQINEIVEIFYNVDRRKNIFKDTVKKLKVDYEAYNRTTFFNKLREEMKKLHDLSNYKVEINFEDYRKYGISNKRFTIKFLKIVNEINTNDKLLLKFPGNIYLTLNNENKKRLYDVLKDRVDVDIAMSLSTSDAEFIASFSTMSGMIVSKITKKAIYAKSSGEFFKYLNKTNIDLSDFQIYNKEQFNKVSHEDSCLYYALFKLDLPVEKLTQLKIFIKNRNVPMCDINKICEKLNIRINIKKICINQGRNKVFNYGNKDIKHVYEIGLIEEHYFIIKDTKYTEYSINNYNKLKDIKDFNNIINDKNQRKNSRFIDSFNLISLFIKNKDELLEPISLDNCDVANTQFYNKVGKDILCLEYDEETNTKIITKNDKQDFKTYQFVFFDFETYKNDKQEHVPYLLCAKYCNLKNDEIKVYKTEIYDGYTCGLDFIKNLNFDSILIAHNVSYDYRFIIDELFGINEISRGNKLLGCNAKIYNKFNKILNVKIMDSYHLIGQPLKNFNKIFKLDVKKEVMPYDLYNLETLTKQFIKLNDCLKYVKNEDKQYFINNVNEWGLLNNNNEVDIIKYSTNYCLIDVDVLHKGYNIFRKWMIEHFEIKTEDCLTIASLAHKFLINKECYDGVYSLSGVPQLFIQGCVVGGRTMCNNNEKQIFENDKMQDFDAVSLYPSAMKRMNGFLKGKPKVLKTLTYEFLKMQDGYFIEILINKVNIKRDFSLMSYKTEEGVRLFTNEMENKNMKVDKITLEDLITFHDIEFTIIRGYYFNEGYNNKINYVIEYIFNKRLELKKLKNPAELTYKLIMNNAYGKSIMKPIEYDVKIFTNKNEFEVFIERNYNWINEYTTFGKNNDKYKVKIYKKLNEHYNICQVGVEILSMSKRIMNEVMTLAQDNNLKIYYQDTDSMHIKEDDINVLEYEFKNKYNRELIGKHMGQFHSDFDLPGCADIYASRSIFLGKKSYIDELKGVDENNNIKTGYHIRMKGIPNSCIEYTTKQLKLNTPFELYEKLLSGQEVLFDLTEGCNKSNFEFTKDYKVYTKSEFNRKIKF